MRALLFKLSAKRLLNNQSSLRFSCNTVSDVVIHPSAVVHPNAVLGQGISIGPFCTVGSSVKLGNGCRLHPGSHIFGNTQLGERCVLMTGAIVGDEIPGRTVVGCNNVIGHHAVVGVKCQDMKYKSGDECFLDVGDNNEIREYSSIHRSSKSSDNTVIGNNNLIMGSCHIAHDCKVGNNVILANNTLLAGHVVVEDYAHTAGAVVVHQFCHVGSFTFIGGGSVIAQDVPKYMMVAGERAQLRGLNLEGLRRHGFTVAERSYPFWQGSRSEALEQLTKRYSCLLMQTPVVLKHVLLKWSSMINWLIYLLCAPWCSLSVTLSEKKDVDYANSDIGIALKSTSNLILLLLRKLMMCIDDMLYEDSRQALVSFLVKIYCDSSRYLMKESVTGCNTKRRFRCIHTLQELTSRSACQPFRVDYTAISFKL